jgi:hypothetical protein
VPQSLKRAVQRISTAIPQVKHSDYKFTKFIRPFGFRSTYTHYIYIRDAALFLSEKSFFFFFLYFFRKLKDPCHSLQPSPADQLQIPPIGSNDNCLGQVYSQPRSSPFSILAHEINFLHEKGCGKFPRSRHSM